MISKAWFLLFAATFYSSASLFAALKVITTTTDLAWAVSQIGGDRVSARSLLKGTENPHFVDAVPEFIRLTSEAQLVVQVGLDLEVGWMPKVLQRSGNQAVQSGGLGFCEASRSVTVLQKATRPVDRSMGDVHPLGNPHYWLGPKAFAQAALAIKDCLVKIDPDGQGDYEEGLKKFQATLTQLLEAQRARLKPYLHKMTSPVILEYHREFSYFFEDYGLKSFDSIEERPGVPPSAGRVAEVSQGAKRAKLWMALAATYSPQSTLRKFEELSSIPVKVVATSILRSGEPSTYSSLQSGLVDAVLSSVPK
jgi:zinc/manganese transport system substrate-binding protein